LNHSCIRHPEVLAVFGEPRRMTNAGARGSSFEARKERAPQDDDGLRRRVEPSSFAKIIFPQPGEANMARRYSKKASAKVGRAMKKRKAGTLKSGRSGRKVKSRKQAIAIGLSEARAEGKKVPKKAAKKRKTAKKRKAKR
jgi:hypothetical protein